MTNRMTGFTLAKISRQFVQLTKGGIRFFSKNSNVILTIVGATGVLTTMAFAIHGTVKAVKLCESKEINDRKEVIKTVWKCYIPTIGVALLTTTAIICNGRINAKKIAVLTSAYSGSVEALKKIEEKMSEQIGPKKTQKAVDEAESSLAKEKMPKTNEEIVATGKGENLFFCATTGQWFRSNWNGVELAELKLQKVFNDIIRNWGQNEVIPLREAQEALGLPVTDMGEYMGWYSDDFIEGQDAVKFIISSEWMDTPNGREMVGVVRFTPWPINL